MCLQNETYSLLQIFKIAGSILLLFIPLACNQPADQKSPDQKAQLEQASKGKTGVFKTYRDGYLYAEISLKEGMKNGPAKRFYPGGSLYSVVYFKNNIRVDTSRSYYTNGRIFRETPYLNGKVEGIQRKFYKDGSLWAEIPHEKGMLKTGLKEMTKTGWPVKYYPGIILKTLDERSKDGTIKIKISLSNQGKRIHFYKGHLENGVFNKANCKSISTEDGIGNLQFITQKENYGIRNINIIGIYTTPLLNKKILQKNITIPYPHLKLINIGR